MLEQVWKNVVKEHDISWKAEGESQVRIVIKRGDRLSINDFGKLIKRVEDSLSGKIRVMFYVNEDGLMEGVMREEDVTAEFVCDENCPACPVNEECDERLDVGNKDSEKKEEKIPPTKKRKKQEEN